MEHGKSRIKNENYIVIQSWLVNELQLKSNELMIYALIYGFSQAEDQCTLFSQLDKFHKTRSQESIKISSR